MFLRVFYCHQTKLVCNNIDITYTFIGVWHHCYALESLPATIYFSPVHRQLVIPLDLLISSSTNTNMQHSTKAIKQNIQSLYSQPVFCITQTSLCTLVKHWRLLYAFRLPKKFLNALVLKYGHCFAEAEFSESGDDPSCAVPMTAAILGCVDTLCTFEIKIYL